jgi:hypothetical protein
MTELIDRGLSRPLYSGIATVFTPPRVSRALTTEKRYGLLAPIYFFLAVLALNAGCGSFADPAIVVDLRTLAITAEPPEQVIDVDLQNPGDPTKLSEQLKPIEVCALIANPDDNRPVKWSMTVCAGDKNNRCTDATAFFRFGEGEVVNPEISQPNPRVCATLMPRADVIALLNEAINNNALSTFGGVDLIVELKFAIAEDFDVAPLFAAKTITYAPRIPVGRTANKNPTLSEITAKVSTAAGQELPAMPLVQGRCVDLIANGQTPLTVPLASRVRLTPVEPAGVREDYVIPTLSGGSLMFSESLTYQWLATAGGFSARNSGGPRDAFGNPAPVFSDWKVPGEIVGGETDISLWVIQRDERLGARWFEMCIRMMP